MTQERGLARPSAGGVATGRLAWAAGLALMACGAAAAPALALPEIPDQLKPVREALMKYQDPIVAVRDGYFSTLGCVQYPEGGMGVHFLNVAYIGPVPDPERPQILVYEPGPDGKLTLAAAEWLIPLATGIKERPDLLGEPFQGPMAGHEPLMPDALFHYDLHVWMFKDNPAGLYSPTNPDIKCSGPYIANETAPRMVANPN